MNVPDILRDVAPVAGTLDIYTRSAGLTNVPSLFQSTQMPRIPYEELVELKVAVTVIWLPALAETA